MKSVVFVLLFALTLMNPQLANAGNFQAAGCFLKAEGGMLLVRDGWSKRWSLPGGRTMLGETPQQTAKREVLEETGFVIEAGNILKEFEDFILLSCEATPHLKVNKNPLGVKNGVATWWVRPPFDARNEILEIRFAAPQEIPEVKWRFPDQRAEIIALYQKQPINISLQEINESSSAPFAVQNGLNVTQLIQSLKIPWLKEFMHAANFFGETNFFFLTLPFLWCLLSREQALLFSVFLILSVIFNGIAKDIFQMTRPFDWLPQLQLSGATGFGLPSGHAQMSATFWGMLIVLISKRWFTAMALLFIIMAGIARIYLGVHFYYDVLVGWAFSLLFILGFKFCVERTETCWLIPRQKTQYFFVLLMWVAVAVLGGWFRPHSELVDAFSALFGAMFGWGLLLMATQGTAHTSLSKQLIAGCIGVLAVFAVVLGFERLIEAVVETHPGVIRAMQFALIGIILPLISLLRNMRIPFLDPKLPVIGEGKNHR